MYKPVHTLIIQNDIITLEGFDTITTQATFCLYQSGIVISSQRLLDSTCHYVANVEGRKIHDANLVAILRGRLYSDAEAFYKVNDNYYETTLHERL